MAIYLVNQGQTYKRERTGGYVLVKSGLQNRGSSLIKEVHKGDFLIHNNGGRLSAISVVQEDCKSGDRPKDSKEGQNVNARNDNDQVIYTQYYEFTTPIYTSDLVGWAAQNYKTDSAFQKDGTIRNQYVCNLENSHAEYLLQMAIGLEIEAEVTTILQAALMKVQAASTAADSRVQNQKELSGAVSEEEAFDTDVVTVESVVLHKKYGAGIVNQIANEKIYVKFACGQRIFLFPEAFEKGWLVF